MKLKFIFSAVALFASIQFAQAQKIAFANIDSIAVSMPEWKVKQAEIESYGKQLNAKMENMQKEYQMKVQNFQANADNMLPEIQQSEVQAIKQLEQNIMSFEQTSRANLARRENALLEPLYVKITGILDAVAKEKGYDYVLPHSLFLYKNEANDLTGSAIARLK